MILAPRETRLGFEPERTLGCCGSALTFGLGDPFEGLEERSDVSWSTTWRFWRDTGDEVAAERCRIQRTHGLGFRVR